MPDDIIRSIPLIARYARHNENEDLSFRTFLKIGANLTDADLDNVVRETTAEVWSQIDCLSCGNCCKTLQIVVDDKDIKRLSNRLGVTLKEFSRKYVGIAADRTKHLLSTPCVFLGEDNKCAVYEDRPQACRDFPYLHESGFRSRSIMMIENTGVCPIVFNVWRLLKDRVGFRRKARGRR